MLEALTVSEFAQQEFDELKKLRKRAVFFKLETAGKQFDLAHAASISMESSHEDVLAAFPTDECRYVYMTVEYFEGHGKRDKNIFVLWVPEAVTVKDKMIYAGWALMMRKKMSIPALSVQCGHTTELEWAELVAKCREHYD